MRASLTLEDDTITIRAVMAGEDGTPAEGIRGDFCQDIRPGGKFGAIPYDTLRSFAPGGVVMDSSKGTIARID